MTRTPRVHSNADKLDDGRLSAPAARRNAAAITEALAPHLPASGTVLEIAAGTGEHAVALAGANPGLKWQPTDVAPERLASIDAWRKAEALENILPARMLDATAPSWREGPVGAIFLANLMHLLPTQGVERLIQGAARSLAPGGRFCIYGPFRTGGAFRSEGDESFDARLRASDPEIGYKDLEWVEETARAAGLARHELIAMPANNLILILEKP